MNELAPDFLTIDEARAILALSRNTAYREARLSTATEGQHGAIPTIEPKPRILRVHRAALEQLLDNPAQIGGPVRCQA